MHNATTPGAIARAGFWFALAFVLNLVWEISYPGLYTIWKGADASRITWAVFHCTVGDAAIALAVFALAAIFSGAPAGHYRVLGAEVSFSSSVRSLLPRGASGTTSIAPVPRAIWQACRRFSVLALHRCCSG